MDCHSVMPQSNVASYKNDDLFKNNKQIKLKKGLETFPYETEYQMKCSIYT